MLIYGSNATHVESVEIDSLACPDCNTKGSIVLSVFSKYAHLFWIPTFPIGKKGAAECQHCKKIMDPKEMPEDLKFEYDNLKSEAQTPPWHFTGLALIVGFIIWFNISSNADKKAELEYINDPIAGDIYEYKTEDGNYSIMKVINVEPGTVYMLPNTKESSRMGGVYKLYEEEFYPEDSALVVPKTALQELYDDGTIYDIKRD